MVVEVAQGQVEGLGDDGEPSELGERLQRGSGGLAVGAGGADGLEHIGFFRPGEEAHAARAAIVAHGQANHIGGPFLAVGIAGVAGQFDGVVQRDHGEARGRVRQECGGKI